MQPKVVGYKSKFVGCLSGGNVTPKGGFFRHDYIEVYGALYPPGANLGYNFVARAWFNEDQHLTGRYAVAVDADTPEPLRTELERAVQGL